MLSEGRREDDNVINVHEGEQPLHRGQDLVYGPMIRYRRFLESKLHACERVRSEVHSDRFILSFLQVDRDLPVPGARLQSTEYLRVPQAVGAQVYAVYQVRI